MLAKCQIWCQLCGEQCGETHDCQLCGAEVCENCTAELDEDSRTTCTDCADSDDYSPPKGD